MYASAYAQKEKTSFHSINTVGASIGEIGTYVMFNSVNGLQNNKWFSGIGAGYDTYYYKSIPLFLDVQRYIGRQNEAMINLDIGYNFPGKNKPGSEIFSYTSFHFSGGLYSNVGVGYKIKFIKKTFFLLHGGYSYKKLKDKIGVVSCPFIGPCIESFTTYNYSFGTLTFRVGIAL